MEIDINNIGITLSIFRIGSVYSVDGRTIRIKVDKIKNSSHLIYRGELIKNISVGGYVKIIKGFTPIIGKVESEFIEEVVTNENNYQTTFNKINRILVVKLLGVLEATSKGYKYTRGIKELPLIEN